MRLVSSGELIFNPYTAVEAQINAAAKSLSVYFGEIDSSLDDGVSVKKALKRGSIESNMRRLLSSSRLIGFQHAAAVTRARMPALYGRDIASSAEKRASKVDRWMHRTTKRVLKSSPDSEHILSSERALSAVQFEAAREYFKGLRDGFQGSGAKKGWVTGSDPCDDCQENEDAEFISMDDDFPSGDSFPPGHLHCFLADTTVTATGVSNIFKRRFKGEVIIISVAGVEDIAVTPNHPILTQRGWISAKQLQLTDSLVQCFDPAGFAIALNPYNNYVETSIQKVANTFRMYGGVVSSSVPTAAPDFHGDMSIDNEVDIISTTGFFANDFTMPLREYGQYSAFVSTNRSVSSAACETFPVFSSPTQVLEATFGTASSSVSGCGNLLSELRGPLFIDQFDSFAYGSLLETEKRESLRYQPSRESGAFSNVCDRLSGLVRLTNPLKLNSRNIDTVHVYNLQTDCGFYLANSIVVHNCGCWLTVR